MKVEIYFIVFAFFNNDMMISEVFCTKKELRESWHNGLRRSEKVYDTIYTKGSCKETKWVLDEKRKEYIGCSCAF